MIRCTIDVELKEKESLGPVAHAEGSADSESTRDCLQGPIRELRGHVEDLPHGLTDRSLLETLVDRSLLRRATVAQYLELRHRSSYAAEKIDRSEASAVSDRLRKELHGAHAEDLRSALQELRPKRSVTSDDDSAQEADAPRFSIGRPIDEAPKDDQGAVDKEVPRRSTRLLALGGLLLFLLGVAAEQVGRRGSAWIHEQIRGRPSERSSQERIEAFRRAITKEPESVGLLNSLASFAFRNDREQEAVFALQRMLSLDPDNVRALNGLAWTHATSEDPLIRDPVRALALSERAYALSQEPRVVDTLAEAAFLTGDIERAIMLAEEAVEASGGQVDYYLRKLARFRAASSADETE